MTRVVQEGCSHQTVRGYGGIDIRYDPEKTQLQIDEDAKTPRAATPRFGFEFRMLWSQNEANALEAAKLIQLAHTFRARAISIQHDDQHPHAGASCGRE